MNSVNDLLDVLNKSGVRLALTDDGGLRIRGDKTHLNELIGEIRKYKEQLVAVLKTSLPFALLTESERASLGEGYEDAYPMSALQAGMVFHTQLEQFNGIYHDINSEYVKCAWDRGCFEGALAACIEEHPILRTGFRLEGERPLQYVHAAGQRRLPLEVEDLRGQPVEQQELYMEQWKEGRKRHVFDWERGPLFHIHIFLRTEESFEFVISFHHSVLDGWSRAALTTGLYQRYERLLRGQELEPVQVDWSYREFIAQEQQVLANESARKYFAGMLEDAPVEQLPRRKPGGREGRGEGRGEPAQGRLVVEPFGALSGRVVQMAKQLGVPVQSLLLAGHFKVLSVVSGQKRVVSCVTHNGRPEAEGAERSLGLFLNSLPQGLEVEKGSWRGLIRKVTELSGASLEYRRYPLSRIQQELGWRFSEVLFNYTHFHIYKELGGGGGREEAGLEALGSRGFEQTNFDLLVDVSRGVEGDGMWLSLVYNAQVLEAEWIGRLGQYYVQAYEHMLEGLDRGHHEQTLLSGEEQEQLLVGWNATQVEYRRDRCLHELFEEQVERSPEAEAVVFEDRRLSYRELNRRANQLAHYLRKQGVKADTLVGLCVERSVEMVVGILGILKAGGGYVPLEPGYPQERLEYMMADSAPAVVVTQASLRERLSASAAPLLLLDGEREQELLGKCPGHNPGRGEVGLTPEHLAYVIYTSGSTGKPKGVMNEHVAVVNRLLWARDACALGSDDRILQKTPFSFDVSVWEFLLPLLSGAQLVMARPGGHMDPRYLAETIEREQITMMHFVPSMLQVFLEHGVTQGCRALRRVLCSGEALPYSLQLRFEAELPGVELHNLYGPTEAAIDVTWWLCQRGIHEGIVPIGRPIANTQIYILDGDLQPAPQGVSGELYIGGTGVARGYWNRPELTAERFIKDPFSGNTNARLYKTGDLARWLPDGVIEYLGRNDFQVKIRGFRIELGEIEQQLSSLPGIHAAIVIAREDDPGEKRLVAYLTMHAEARQGASETAFIVELRRGLQSRLPDYMVPAAFVVLDELPLTSNGKVDRKALPAPDAVFIPNQYVAPATPVEIALARIWADLLRLDSSAISVTANLFELGGHSLMLVKLVTEIRNKFAVELSIRDVLEHPQLNVLAGQISETALRDALSAGSEYEIGSDEMEVTV